MPPRPTRGARHANSTKDSSNSAHGHNDDAFEGFEFGGENVEAGSANRDEDDREGQELKGEEEEKGHDRITTEIASHVEGRHSRRWIDRTKVDSYEPELKNYKVVSRLLIGGAQGDGVISRAYIVLVKRLLFNRISNLKQAIQTKSSTESTVSAPSNAPGVSTQL